MAAAPASAVSPARPGPSRVDRALRHRLGQPVAIALLLLPLAWLLYGAVAGRLGANPAEALIRGLGDWTLRCLVATLAVTPLRQWTGWNGLVRFRRTLGLAAFGYALLHFVAFAWLDMGLDPAAIVRDVAKRPFILVGSAALLTMLPLAATSTARAQRALGGARWKALHRLVYATAVLAILHFFWMRAGKNDVAEVLAWAAVVALLLLWRTVRRLRRAKGER